MKKILMFLLAMTIGMTALSAKETSYTTTTFSVKLHCEACVKKVMNSIPFNKGVKDVVANLERKEVTVTYDPKKNDDKRLIAAFNRLRLPAVVVKTPAAPATTQCKTGCC